VAQLREDNRDVEQTIGVFGEEMLLWISLLRQSPVRPPAEHVHRQANLLLDELKQSKLAMELPVQSVDDGMFVIAALLDEWAMALPDLRPMWSQYPLQARRWMTNNAGAEVFQRLERVRQGPKSVLATYMVVLGLGFVGRFALPGTDKYGLVQLRNELCFQFGIDPDKDWKGGVLRPTRADGPAPFLPQEPWHRRLWFGRGIAISVFVVGLLSLVSVLWSNLR
jgi:type VI secretion system protein ImpK